MPLTREKMFSKKNIIVIAIMAIMLMGSVVLSAGIAQVSTNGNGKGYIMLQEMNGPGNFCKNVVYEKGENYFYVPTEPNKKYWVTAYGISDENYETDVDYSFFLSGARKAYLELDIDGFFYYDPTQPSAR